jgi:hypothetical protein
MAGAISTSDTGSTVLIYNWLDGSATNSIFFGGRPWDSRRNADESGTVLRVALEEAFGTSSPVNLHLIGHSHGFQVAISAATSGDLGVTRLTALDAPADFAAKFLSGSVDWSDLITAIEDDTIFVDNYITVTGVQQSSAKVRNVELPGLGIGSHGYPREWYTSATEADAGFGLFWSPSFLEDPITGHYSQDPTNDLALVYETFVFFGDPILNPVSPTTLFIAGGVVEDPIAGTVTFTEFSSAYWHSEIELGANDRTLMLDYQFLDVGDGDEMAVWIDGAMHYRVVGVSIGTDAKTAAIDLSMLALGTHMVSVALHSYGGSGSSFQVSNFQILSQAPISVPALGTGALGLLMATLCVAGVARIREVRRA